MKKKLGLLLVAAMLLSLVGCAARKDEASVEAYYKSTDEVTLDKIKEMSSPEKMLEYKGGVNIEFFYRTDDVDTEGEKASLRYVKEGDIIHANQFVDYPEGYFTHMYFSNDKDDETLYVQFAGGADFSPISAEEIDSALKESIFGFESVDARLATVKADGTNFIAEVEIYYGDNKLADINITLDSVSGYPVASETAQTVDGVESIQVVTITYGKDITIDYTPKTEALKSTGNTSTGAGDKLSFSTVDIDGNTVTDAIMKDAKVVLINFWEPWCGPCVGEMPDLEKLYEAYKDKGFLIIGVFSTNDMDDDARQVLTDCKITYPIIRGNADLAKYMTDYVPTTIFVDGEGNLLSTEPVIGANSYANWEKIIEGYLK